jgi:hypothetical protein
MGDAVVYVDGLIDKQTEKYDEGSLRQCERA